MADNIWDGVIQSIARDGWVPSSGTLDGPGCILRHVQKVEGRTGDRYIPYFDLRPRAQELVPIIQAQFPERFVGSEDPTDAVVDFNDHRETAVEDVIMVCEKARASETL